MLSSLLTMFTVGFSLLLFFVSGSGASVAEDIWSLVLLTEEVQTMGAQCIDGTPAAFYFKPGTGENASKYIIFWEGGGWCTSFSDCQDRSLTPLGSSKTYPNSTNEYTVRDVLDVNCTNNPNFCTWSTAYAPYCDGQSRAGNLQVPVLFNNTRLNFRGYRNLEATINRLLTNYGLNTATHVLISGSSAGGLTSILHADYINSTVRQVNPNVILKVIPEVGFFLDAESIWNQQHLYTTVYTRIADFANVTHGFPQQVNEQCIYNTPFSENWKCFMAQYTYPYVSTPIFLLNSVVDEWQTSNILAPNSNVTDYVTTYGAFVPCIEDPLKGCNSTQHDQWFGYADQFMKALNTSIQNTPEAFMNQNGGFITSCPIHTTAIGGLSQKIHINGVSMYQALSDWYFETKGPGGAQYWTHDVPYPNNPTCPKPGPALDIEIY